MIELNSMMFNRNWQSRIQVKLLYRKNDGSSLTIFLISVDTYKNPFKNHANFVVSDEDNDMKQQKENENVIV